MKAFIAIASLMFSSQLTLAAPISATVNYESQVLTTEGVKKQTQFQERLVRDKGVVWNQRIVPSAAPKIHRDEHEDHEHNLNFALAGKWLTRDDKGDVTLRFVRDDGKKIIEPRVTEYGTLGFNGDWDAAYYLVTPAELKTMTAMKKTSPAGTHWYERRDEHLYTRVLWDEKNELPLSIESGRYDGTQLNKITLTITPAPSPLPWKQLNSYQQIAYEDLLD